MPLLLSPRTLGTVSLMILAAACGGGGDRTAPQVPVASKLELGTASLASGTVGAALPTSPTFTVRDQDDNPMAGVPLSVEVNNGGSLTGAPVMSNSGGTPVGTWTLGKAAGTNTLTVTSGSLTPLTITVQGTAGPVATLTPQTSTTIEGIVAQSVSVRVSGRDVFGNPTVGAVAAVAVSGGGTAPQTVTAGPDGVFTIQAWTLGSTPGANTLAISAGSATVQFSAITVFGTPNTIAVQSGDGQLVLAGRAPTTPIVFAVRDQFDNLLPGVAVTFSVLTGGGTITSTTGTTNAEGIVTAPAWKVGTSVVPQRIRASVGTLAGVASATIESSFNISVRFYGPSMTAEQQALFTDAANRISAMVVGDIPAVNAPGIDLAAYCNEPGLPIINEVIDDIVIYASIATIDGPGQVLAQAGPCAARTGPSSTVPGLPVIGIMQFDVSDLATLAGGGSLQEVITHEMMHVLGIGTFWEPLSLLRDVGSATVNYVGANAITGCRDGGGSTICATTVPVENTGGGGTRDGHWRETVFGNEIMTGYANAGGMPISRMTIGAFLDMGYAVNSDAASTYRIPGTGAPIASMSAARAAAPTTTFGVWEEVLQPKILISREGGVRRRQ